MIELGAEFLTPWLLVFARAVGLTVLLPFVGTRQTPRLVRMSVVAILTLTMAPGFNAPANERWLLLDVAREFAVGALVGLVCRLIWELLLLPIALIDGTLGRSNIARGSLVSDEGEGALTQLGGLAFLAVFAASATHLDALRTLGRLPTRWTLADAGAVAPLLQASFELAAGLVLPAFLVALLVDLTLGWANRTLPSLPAMFIAMPSRAILGWLIVPSLFLCAASATSRELVRWLDSLVALGPP